MLSGFCNDKTHGSDGLTPSIEFYCLFWCCIGKYVVDSLYAFCKDSLSTQKLGIVSLIPKKNKSLEHLKNCRPISLLSTENQTIAVRRKSFALDHPSVPLILAKQDVLKEDI